MIFKLILVFILIIVLSYIALLKTEYFTTQDLNKAIDNYANNQQLNNNEQMNIYMRDNKEKKFKEMKENVDKYYDKLEQLKQVLFKSNKLVCRDEDLIMPLKTSIDEDTTDTINSLCGIQNSSDKAIIDCIHKQIETQCNKLKGSEGTLNELQASKESCLGFKAPNTGASYCTFTPGNKDLGLSNKCESKKLKAPCLHVCRSGNEINNPTGCKGILKLKDEYGEKGGNVGTPLVVPTKSRIYIYQ